MKFYKVGYELGPNGQYVYPESTKGVTWRNVHYHNSEHQIIGETESQLVVDGSQVVELTKEDAVTLIKKFKESFPPPPEEEPESPEL